MDVLIFSKNRAIQLLACIQSFKDYCKEFNNLNINILYRSTNDELEKGYDIIKNILKLNTNISWHKEKNFQTQTKNIISNMKNQTMMFLVDDILFVNNFSLYDQQFELMRNNIDYLILSLRLHSGVNRCYATDKPNKVPQFVKKCIWNWQTAEGDWNYPMSLDGNVYKTALIKEKIKYLYFYNPNTLEALLDRSKDNIPSYLCCYLTSPKLINVPANKVQDVYNNRFEKSISINELNEILLSGKKISYKEHLGIKPDTVHVPIVYNYVNI